MVCMQSTVVLYDCCLKLLRYKFCWFNQWWVFSWA